MLLSNTEESRFELLEKFDGLHVYEKPENYKFISSRIKVNGYQFGQVFMKERQVGYTYGLFMKKLIEIKETKYMVVWAGSFDSRHQSSSEENNEFQRFLQFIEEYFKGDFELDSVTKISAKITYTGNAYKELYPEEFI